VSTAAFLLLAKFSPNFGLKNMISINIKGFFHGENGPNLPDFKEKKIPNRQILMISSSGYFFFVFLSYFHMSYIAKFG
jgi:hypothetical protein